MWSKVAIVIGVFVSVVDIFGMYSENVKIAEYMSKLSDEQLLTEGNT
jgi:hypothetical protein